MNNQVVGEYCVWSVLLVPVTSIDVKGLFSRYLEHPGVSKRGPSIPCTALKLILGVGEIT